MSSAPPLLSIGLPVFNGEAYLARALGALVTQDYERIEIVVCDNGSTDATPDIARSFAADDRRIRVHGTDVNRGAARNFNWALELARGTYFKWAAYDDLCAPTFASRCVEVLEAAGPEVVLCYPKTALIDEDDLVIGTFEDDLVLDEREPHARLRHLFRTRTEYHPIFGVVRTEVLRRTQRMGNYVGADIVLLAELALAGRFAEHPDRLFLRRLHAQTSVRANPHVSDRAAWFDPRHRGRPVVPGARQGTELFKAISALDAGGPEKARCANVVVRDWLGPRWRDIGGEVKLALGQAVFARWRRTARAA